MLRRARRRKGISLTPLVDVIFLLLLFFMLTSTFSRFAEVPLSTATAGTAPDTDRVVFVQLFPARVTLNGQETTLDTLSFDADRDQSVLVALQPEVTAQRLTDLLVALRRFPGLSVTVLGSG